MNLNNKEEKIKKKCLYYLLTYYTIILVGRNIPLICLKVITSQRFKVAIVFWPRKRSLAERSQEVESKLLRQHFSVDR